MITFWLVCAVFVAIGLAFVLPPMLQREENEEPDGDKSGKEANVDVYRDQLAELETDRNNGIVSQEQYQQDREELEHRLLEDVAGSEPTVKRTSGSRNLAYAVALGLPVIAVVFYLRVGHSTALSATPAPAGRPAASAPPAETGDAGFTPERIQANVAALAKKLEQNPNDVQGWIMLARSYTSLEKYPEASAAYKKATELKSNDADLLADYAFSVAMANGRTLTGEPTEIINRALKIDPENPKVLQLAGSAAFEAHDYRHAIEYWEKVLRRAPNDPELGPALTDRINEAKKQLGTAPTK